MNPASPNGMLPVTSKYYRRRLDIIAVRFSIRAPTFWPIGNRHETRRGRTGGNDNRRADLLAGFTVKSIALSLMFSALTCAPYDHVKSSHSQPLPKARR